MWSFCFSLLSTAKIFQQIRQNCVHSPQPVRSYLFWLKWTSTSHIQQHMTQMTYYHNSWFWIIGKIVTYRGNTALRYWLISYSMVHSTSQNVLSLTILSTNKHNNSHILILSVITQNLLLDISLVYLGCNSSFHLQF